jgi:hypothetical protein
VRPNLILYGNGNGSSAADADAMLMLTDPDTDGSRFQVKVKVKGWIIIMTPCYGVGCKPLQSRLYFQLICI